MTKVKEGTCEHKKTIIWEPHLAGARKCKDCGWVKSPNRVYLGKSLWFDEDAEILQRKIDKVKYLTPEMIKFIPAYKLKDHPAVKGFLLAIRTMDCGNHMCHFAKRDEPKCGTNGGCTCFYRSKNTILFRKALAPFEGLEES